jgi:HD-like signal output (HDOD) protein
MSATATAPAAAAPTVRSLIERLEELGTLPEVTVKINKIVKDPDSSPDDLEEVINHDPALASRVMKIANSSLYSLPSPVKTVKRAVVMLGFKSVNRVAMAASLGHMFKGKLCAKHSAKDLWTHSIAVAAVARDLATKVAPEIAEEVFLAGLTHDLGLVALLQVMPKELAAVCDKAEKDPRPFVEIEREMIGMDHEQIGASLTTAWGFPPACRMAAGAHHHPATEADETGLVTDLVHVADTLCCGERVGFSYTAQRQTVPPALAAKFGLNEESWGSTKERVTALAYAATTIFA